MNQAQPAFDTIARARGHWPQILRAIGVEQQFLSNKHGPCPLCGGKDRYRFDNRNNDGSYYCSQCGAGVGILLVRKMLKVDHATACRRVDEILGDSPNKIEDDEDAEPRR